MIHLAPHRSPGASAFEPAERRALARSCAAPGPAGVAAPELPRRRSGSEAHRVPLDPVPHALFPVDGASRPVAVNAAAAAPTEAGGPSRVEAGRLAVERQDEDETLRRAGRAASTNGQGGAGLAELALGHEGSPRPIP